MEEGQIVCHVRTNPLGMREHIGYEWQGGPVTYIAHSLFYDSDIQLDGDCMVVGPYRLRIIDQEGNLRQYYRCVRLDYPFWWLVLAWHRYGRLLDIAYRRLIITLAVWGLARYSQATIPSWEDVHVLRKISEWLKR